MDTLSREAKNALIFFEDDNAQVLFAEVDSHLRNGTHVQQTNPEQRAVFHFIRKNSESLNNFYQLYYRLELKSGSSRSELYYYLDRIPGQKPKLEEELKPLDSAETLIALILCKITQTDLQELDSVEALQQALNHEYLPYKEGLFKQLLKLKYSEPSDYDEERMRKMIESAIARFKTLGWLAEVAGKLVVMPSINRIRTIYADEINSLSDKI